MGAIKAYINFANTFSEWVGMVLSWFASLLVFLVFFNVVMRYAIGFTYLSVQELQWHVFGAMFMLGAGYALKHERHVRVDIFYTQMSPWWRAMVDFLGTLFFLVPFCIVAMYYSASFVEFSFRVNEGSPNPGGLPARYIVKSLIPIGLGFLLVQGVAFGLEALLALMGEDIKRYKEGHSEEVVV